jgi:hypothetical protein
MPSSRRTPNEIFSDFYISAYTIGCLLCQRKTGGKVNNLMEFKADFPLVARIGRAFFLAFRIRLNERRIEECVDFLYVRDKQTHELFEDKTKPLFPFEPLSELDKGGVINAGDTLQISVRASHHLLVHEPEKHENLVVPFPAPV